MPLLISSGLGRPVDGGKSALISTSGLGQWGPSDCASSSLAALGVENFSTYLHVVFNNTLAISGDAAVASKWTMTTGDPSAAVPVVTAVSVVQGNRIRLDLSEQTLGILYTLNFPTAGIVDTASRAYTGPFSLTFGGVGLGPGVSMARALDARTLEVLFTEAVDPVTASVITNYSISPTLAVMAVTRITDWVYRLTTAKQTFNTVYTVTISNIKDLAKNPVPAH